MRSGRVVGMVKRLDCAGIEGGRGGSLDGAGTVRRGASRSGSTFFRYVVKTSGSSLGLENGRSRLQSSASTIVTS